MALWTLAGSGLLKIHWWNNSLESEFMVSWIETESSGKVMPHDKCYNVQTLQLTSKPQSKTSTFKSHSMRNHKHQYIQHENGY